MGKCSTKEYSQGRDQQEIKITSPGNAPIVPDNIFTLAEPKTPEQVKAITLKRGSHKIRGYLPNIKTAALYENKQIALPIDGEFKRIFVHKLDVQPPEMNEEAGEMVSRFTADITILDNPLPLVPIFWGLAGIGTFGSGWFFVDKVESFTETGTGKVITILAALITIILSVIAIRSKVF